MSTVGPFSENRFIIIQEGISFMLEGILIILRGIFSIAKGFIKPLADLFLNIILLIVTHFINSTVLIFRMTLAGKALQHNIRRGVLTRLDHPSTDMTHQSQGAEQHCRTSPPLSEQ
jgi:hypothetical protein